MKLVLQPLKSKLCGQACVAMLAGVSLEQACRLVGHKKGTTTKKLVQIFRQLGFECPNRLVPIYDGKLPNFGLVKMKKMKSNGKWMGGWHWMAVWDGVIHDPAGTYPHYVYEIRVSSYLPLTKVKRS